MKKALKLSFIMTVCQLFLLAGYSQENVRSGDETQDNSSPNVVSMEINFRPNRVETRNMSIPVEIDCPCFFTLTKTQIIIKLLDYCAFRNLQRRNSPTGLDQDQIDLMLRKMYISPKTIDRFTYDIYSEKDGGYKIDARPVNPYSTRFYYGLDFDKDGYGTLTIYEQSGKIYYPAVIYHGLYSYVINEQEVEELEIIPIVLNFIRFDANFLFSL